ncbi:hypothetical protein [Hydrococcus rivularis]|nr:hypothetical protein [Hydrococcus rivularis]
MYRSLGDRACEVGFHYRSTPTHDKSTISRVLSVNQGKVEKYKSYHFLL